MSLGGMLICDAELCSPTLASISDLHWIDPGIIHHQCFHELNSADGLPWGLYVFLCHDLSSFLTRCSHVVHRRLCDCVDRCSRMRLP
jgi:hypothetical protein